MSWYGHVGRLTIQKYGINDSGAAAEGARPTVVEAAAGRPHNSGWGSGKHGHTNSYLIRHLPDRGHFSEFLKTGL